MMDMDSVDKLLELEDEAVPKTPGRDLELPHPEPDVILLDVDETLEDDGVVAVEMPTETEEEKKLAEKLAAKKAAKRRRNQRRKRNKRLRERAEQKQVKAGVLTMKEVEEMRMARAIASEMERRRGALKKKMKEEFKQKEERDMMRIRARIERKMREKGVGAQR